MSRYNLTRIEGKDGNPSQRNKVRVDNAGNLQVGIGSGGNSTDFADRIRTSEKEELFTHAAFSMKNHTMIEDTAGSGSSTFQFNLSATDLNTTTASGDRVTRQSFHYIPYLPGSPVSAKMTGVFAESKANVSQRIGMFDNDNGVFFEDDGTGMGVVRRTKTSGSIVNNRVSQADWNIDPLDGTGPSGETVTSWNEWLLFWVEYLWQGAVGVKWGIIKNGKRIKCHQYYPDGETVPFISKPNLPARYEIENTGTAASGTKLVEGCVDVVAEGGHRLVGSDWAFGTKATPINVGTSEEVVLVARLKTSFDSQDVRRIIKLLTTSFLADTEDVYVRVAVVHSPTSVTGGSWTSVDSTHSAIEYNVGQPTITGGDNHTFDEYFVPASSGGQGQSGSGSSQSRFDDTHSLAVQNYDSSVSDLFVIYATAMANTTNVWASMHVLEYE